MRARHVPFLELRRAAKVLALAGSLVGCAHHPRTTGVPIDQRPTPPQPPPEDAAHTGVTPSPPPSSSPGTTMGSAEREQTLQRIVADTTAASVAVNKCATKNLLPDQASVFETTRGYLVQARAALRRNELWEAESFARKARQLALSLECY
jgi:hypothetical protein